MRTDKNVSQNSFRQSKQWQTDPFRNISVPEIDRRLKGSEIIDGRMVVHSLSGKERNHLFVNHDGTFSDLSLISGLDTDADSRGFVTFDFDRDGMQDIALVNANAPLLNLYKNNLRDTRRSDDSAAFVALRFVGGNNSQQPSSGATNRDGYGAMVELQVGDVDLIREHRCGEGYGTQNSSTMMVGIGTAKMVDRIRIKWPSGESHEISNIDSGSLVTMYENRGQSPNKANFVVQRYEVAQGKTNLVNRHENLSVFDLGQVTIYPQTDRQKKPKLRLYVSMATWCTACLKHKPDLEQIMESCGDDLEIIGLPIDASEDDERLRNYVDKHKPAYSVVLNLTTDQRRQIAEVYSFINPPDVVPSSVLTDSLGRLIAGKAGVPTVSDIRQQLSKFTDE